MTPVRCLIVVVGLALAVAGCREETKPAGKSATSAGPVASTGKEAAGQCEAVLSSIDDIFQLQRLGRTTAVSDGVARLNDWQRACGSDVDSSEFKLPPEVRKLLSEEQAQSLTQTRFSLRDGEHLRDCLLERTISGYAVGQGQTDLEKVANVFGHVVRAIGLAQQPLHDLPLTVYEVYLLGKGTAADRAWIFASVLRQLKIDAVLIYPGGPRETAAHGDRQPMLVGVLLDGEVYLFDPQAGVPIPAPGTATAPSRAATLTEAATEPAVLKQLDAPERPYPVRAADLEHPDLAIVGDTGFWSSRMQALQTQFVGNRAMIIADPFIEPGADAGGLWSRVVKAGGGRWSADDVRLWDYPEARLAAHLRMTKDQQETLEGLLKPFEAFLNVEIDPRNGLPILLEKERAADPAADQKLHPGVHVNEHTTVGEQMRARLDHLGGDFSEAVKRYTRVRGKSKEVLLAGPPLPIQSSHSRAIDDASYWTALCQFEQGEYKLAVNNLTKYREQRQNGHWGRESRYLLALSLAATDDRAGAIRLLQPVDSDDPEYTGYRLLIRQWQAAGKKPVKEAT
jgi:hypothetical protein